MNWRVLAILAVMVLIQTHLASTVARGAGQGRDLSGCVQTCNTFEGTCKDDCQVDCAALWPVPSPEFDACNSACVQVCGDVKKDCKAKCNVHGRPHPVEP
jgi:hypothetical protein